VKIKTQTEAAGWLDELTDAIAQAEQRYDKLTTGTHLRAAGAEQLTKLYTLRAQVYDQIPALFSGGNTATRIALAGASDGALWSRREARAWHGIARELRAEADRIEREAAPVFAVSEQPHRNLIGEKAAKYRARARQTGQLRSVPRYPAGPRAGQLVNLDTLDGGA
jgi:hypothetical protein